MILNLNFIICQTKLSNQQNKQISNHLIFFVFEPQQKKRYQKMEQSSLSSKSMSSINGNQYDSEKKIASNVNWISVINFLQTQYTKSTLQQKQWFLQKKLLNQEILKLKNELYSVQKLNSNLNNRIKLLQNALRKQKLMKQPQTNKQKSVTNQKTLQQIQKYFQKNGWNLSEKPKTFQETTHKNFLNKVLDEVGLNLNTIGQRCRKLSMISVQTERLEGQNKTENFHVLMEELNKVKISSNTKINGHLDAVRGLFAIKNMQSQNLLVSVSQDCLVKSWNLDIKSKDTNQMIEPISTFRQHTGQLFTIDGGQQNGNDLVVFTAGTEDCVKLWYTENKDKLQKFKCIGSFINETPSSQDKSAELQSEIIWNVKYKSQKLLTSASDGIVRLFNTCIESNQNKYAPHIEFLRQFNEKGYIQSALQWVGDRAFLATCSNSPRVHLWDVERTKIVQRYLYEIQKIKDEKSNVKKDNNFMNLFQINSIKYSSQIRNIFAACEDKIVRIFSYDDTKMIKKLDNGVNDAINCLELYKTNFIVAGCQNGALKIWDRRTYRLLIDEQAHKTKYDEGILCLRATDQGIFTGGADGVINFYTI